MKNDLTTAQKKRVVTEFAAIEARLDTVLFAQSDDDEDDFPVLKTAGVLGIGVGSGLGINAIRKRGNRINTAPTGGFIMPGTSEPAPLGSQMQPVGHPGYVRPTTVLQDLKTGGKSVAADAKAGLGEAAENLSAMFRRLIGKGAQAAAKAA